MKHCLKIFAKTLLAIILVILLALLMNRPARPIYSVVGPRDPVTYKAITWSPDGEMLAIGGHVGVKLYSIEFEKITELSIEGSDIWALGWSPDSSQLAGIIVGSTDTSFFDIYIWDIQSNEPPTILDNPAGVSIAWRSDGKYLASGDINGYSYIWDVENQSVVERFSANPTDYGSDVATICWSLDGTQVYTLYQSSVFEWDLELDPIQEIPQLPEGGCDAERQFLVDMNGEVKSLATGEVVFSFPDEYWGIVAAEWSSDGTRIAAASYHETYNQEDGTFNSVNRVQIWDVETHELITTLETGQRLELAWHYRNTISWSPDGSLLATLNQGSHVQIWRTDTFELVNEFAP